MRHGNVVDSAYTNRLKQICGTSTSSSCLMFDYVLLGRVRVGYALKLMAFSTTLLRWACEGCVDFFLI